MPKPRPLPLGAELGPTIARMHQIAAESGDRLYLSDGPPHPDAELLDLCSEILQAARLADEARRAREESSRAWDDAYRPGADKQEARVSELEQLDTARMAEWQRLETKVKVLSSKARKLRATTPAGIFAKALIVRLSKTGAALLAMGLAEELIDCAELRRSLWPAQSAEAAP